MKIKKVLIYKIKINYLIKYVELKKLININKFHILFNIPLSNKGYYILNNSIILTSSCNLLFILLCIPFISSL